MAARGQAWKRAGRLEPNRAFTAPERAGIGKRRRGHLEWQPLPVEIHPQRGRDLVNVGALLAGGKPIVAIPIDGRDDRLGDGNARGHVEFEGHSCGLDGRAARPAGTRRGGGPTRRQSRGDQRQRRATSAARLPARKLRSVVVGRIAIDRVDVIDAALRRVLDHERRPLDAEVRRAAVGRRAAPGEVGVVDRLARISAMRGSANASFMMPAHSRTRSQQHRLLRRPRAPTRECLPAESSARPCPGRARDRRRGS